MERPNHTFCSRLSMVDAPFPICSRHALDLFTHMAAIVAEAVTDTDRMAAATEAASLGQYDDALAPRLAWARQRDEQVYYLRLNGLVKIGTSGSLLARLASYPPGTVLLATEPGGRELENARHRQFAGSRMGRGEWFRPTDALLEHIATLTAEISTTH